MANLGISLWKDYGSCINILWHISYAMKLWLSNTKEGFDGVLVLKRIRYGLNYGDVGKNCVNSGNQGGAFLYPWKEWETSHKRWIGHLCDSFGSASGGLCDFHYQVFMLCGVKISPSLTFST